MTRRLLAAWLGLAPALELTPWAGTSLTVERRLPVVPSP
jgi:hypothetical protein